MPMEFEFRIPKATWAAGALAGAGIDADLVLPQALRGIGGNPITGVVGGNARCQLRSITIVAQDSTSGFDLLFFSKATRFPANRDNNVFLGKFSFTAASGISDSSDGTASTYWYIDGLDIPIRDDDGTGKLHITLIPRTAALTAGHDVVIELRMAPLSQFP